MKRIAFLATALVSSSIALTPAVARDWSYVTTNSAGVAVAVSSGSFVRAGDQVSGLFRFRERQGYSYHDVRIDCRSGKIADTAVSGPTERALAQDVTYRPVVQGSVGAFLRATLCLDGWGRPVTIQPIGPTMSMPPPVLWANTGARN